MIYVLVVLPFTKLNRSLQLKHLPFDSMIVQVNLDSGYPLEVWMDLDIRR